jgi:hypothetical protein
MLGPGFQIIGSRVGPSHAHTPSVEFVRVVSVCGMVAARDDVIHADRHGAVVIPADAVRLLPAAIDLITCPERIILDVCIAANFTPAKLRAAATIAQEID